MIVQKITGGIAQVMYNICFAENTFNCKYELKVFKDPKFKFTIIILTVYQAALIHETRWS